MLMRNRSQGTSPFGQKKLKETENKEKIKNIYIVLALTFW